MTMICLTGANHSSCHMSLYVCETLRVSSNDFLAFLFGEDVEAAAAALAAASSSTSRLRKKTMVVETMNTMPKKYMNLSMGTRPYVCVSRPSSGRKYLLEKSADSMVRKITLPMNQPAVWPTELHVDAQPTFSLKNKANNRMNKKGEEEDESSVHLD